MRKRQERLAAFLASRSEMQDLREQAESIVADPILDSAWPVDCEELADKLQRESWGLLRSSESPVRNKDRKLITDKLPPCVQVGKDDIQYTK